MIDAVTFVQAEGVDLGLPPAREPTGTAAGPATALTLRFSDRAETVVAGLHPAARTGSVGFARADDQVVADVHDAGIGWLRVADVIVGARDASRPQDWLRSVFDRHPGCAVGATFVRGGALLAGLRDGGVVRVIPEAGGRRSREELMTCASFVHAWVANGRDLALLDRATLRLVTTSRWFRLRTEVVSAPAPAVPGLPGLRVSARSGVLRQR
jgi:hypothetical protein